MNDIQPIETVYQGYRFRSRLEARWAVAFEMANVRYEYEPDGFDLGKDGGWYLPDFYLPDESIYLEIKPDRMEYEHISVLDLSTNYRMANRVLMQMKGMGNLSKILYLVVGDPYEYRVYRICNSKTFNNRHTFTFLPEWVGEEVRYYRFGKVA